MFTISHTEYTSASPKAVWAILEDVGNWGKWDKTLVVSTIEGNFAEGACGLLQAKGQPLFKTIISQLSKYEHFTQEIRLRFVTFSMSHTIVEEEGRTKVTFQTRIKGPLALLYYCLLKKQIQDKLPLEMEEMLKLATKNE